MSSQVRRQGDGLPPRGWIPKSNAPFAKTPASGWPGRRPRHLNESEAHKQCKLAIYEALKRQPQVRKVQMERPLGTVRPDVSAYINGVPVAIEVQISRLSRETIVRRTIEYARKGIYVLWLPQWTPALDRVRYSPTIWEKWVHATYFGQVYYWIEGLTVVPYHFDRGFVTVSRTTWYPGKGMKITAGAYSRRSKRYRCVVRGDALDLTKDFGPKERDWWDGNKMAIPFAKLYMHRRRRKAR